MQNNIPDELIKETMESFQYDMWAIATLLIQKEQEVDKLDDRVNELEDDLRMANNRIDELEDDNKGMVRQIEELEGEIETIRTEGIL